MAMSLKSQIMARSVHEREITPRIHANGIRGLTELYVNSCVLDIYLILLFPDVHIGCPDASASICFFAPAA